MSDIAIKVENISKLYRLGQTVGYQTLRESLVKAISAPFHRRSAGTSGTPGYVNGDTNKLWALKDISFEVKNGEAIGIIGRNGAGKSTLLKVLSRITEPTEGHIRIRGRVGSLLEVGTGFHPELTGRENVYLNGAILGMKKKEITRKFDEIVAFSGIEAFIDTPLKRYSTGMGVRLAFAVAAHLEPEILLVDEVLAVGDYEFQKKCLGKMGEVAKGGRTVLFVSHNMGAIANLCSKTVLLEQGRVALVGETREVITKYISSGAETGGEVNWSDPKTAPGNENVRLKAVRIKSNGRTTRDVPINEDIYVEIDYWNLKENAFLESIIHLRDNVGSFVLESANWPSANLLIDEWVQKPRPIGIYRSSCIIPANFLNDEQYSIDIGLLNQHNKFEVRKEYTISFVVHETGEQKNECSSQRVGVVRPRLKWSTKYLESND